MLNSALRSVISMPESATAPNVRGLAELRASATTLLCFAFMLMANTGESAGTSATGAGFGSGSLVRVRTLP